LYTDAIIFLFVGLLIALIAAILLRNWAKKRLDTEGKDFPVFLTSAAMFCVIPYILLAVSGN